MALQVEEYLSHRRSLGFKLRAEGELLASFARYVNQKGHRGPLTTSLAVEWAQKGRTPTMQRARRLQCVHRFAQYRALFDPKTEIPPKDLLGVYRPPRRFYIYTDREIRDLLIAASQARYRSLLVPVVYPTLFGLLACTGLRVSEALGLTDEDVDLQQGVLRVRYGKFGKSRYLPVAPSTLRALHQYEDVRDRRLGRRHGHVFLLGDDGRPLTYRRVLGKFHRLRWKLGWLGNDRTRWPRIHDLRHTFAVRRLLRWYQEGSNVDEKILLLSTYLGHVNVTKTYWYLTAVPELLAIVGARFHEFAKNQMEGVS